MNATITTLPEGHVYERVARAAGIGRSEAEAACEALHGMGLNVQTHADAEQVAATLKALSLLPERPGKVFSVNLQTDLTVVARHFAQYGTGDERNEVRASQDGIDFDTAEWHDPKVDGAEGENIYVERIVEGRVVFHGWASSRSRKLTQTG
jgi:hypothetical protein